MTRLFPKIIMLACCAILMLPAQTAQAMSLKAVLQQVMDHQPSLKVSLLDRAIAATETARIEGSLDPVVAATITASDEKTPTVSDFQPSENRIGQLNGTISKPLADGSTVGANFVYIRNSQGFNSPFAAQLARFNPTYRNQINIDYRYPLLKGAKRPDYQQSLISAQAGEVQAEQQRLVIAHNLALQALNAYYQLASDDINIDIAKQAVKRAKTLLSYQRSREQFGLIEKADRLQAAALLAARRTDLQRAISRRINDQNTLNRLMLRRADTPLDIERQVQTVDQPEPQALSATLSRAEKQRPELQVLDAQMQAADASLIIAKDSDQMQLDIVASAGTRALNKQPLQAAASGLSLHDHFASLSLELSDVIGRNSARAAIHKAELQRLRIEAERERTLEQIRDDISAAHTAIVAGIPTLAVARKQVHAEQRKFRAEMKRYRQGRSDTATLVQFEGELRNAALNAQLQQLTLELAEQQLAWAEGSLLPRLGVQTAVQPATEGHSGS